EAMPLRNDAMDRSDGSRGLAAGGGLVLDGGQRIAGDVVAFEGEELLHGGDGDVNLLVVEIVVAAADFAGFADHLELRSIDGDGLVKVGAAGKQERCGFRSEHHDAASFGQV